jgi:hypothetical protein
MLHCPRYGELRPGGGLSKDRSDEDAAYDGVVVQGRAVGPIPRPLPVPAAGAAELKHDPDPKGRVSAKGEAVFRRDHAQMTTKRDDPHLVAL